MERWSPVRFAVFAIVEVVAVFAMTYALVRYLADLIERRSDTGSRT